MVKKCLSNNEGGEVLKKIVEVIKINNNKKSKIKI